MAKFEITSFRGGISDYEDKGIVGAFKLGLNLDIRKKTDSLTCQQGLTTEAPSGGFDSLVKFIVPSSDGNSYLYTGSGKVYKRTSAGVITLVYTDSAGAILGACEWVLSSGKTYQFWATATAFNCKEIPGNSGWTDVNALGGFPKTLTSSSFHTMCDANGVLLICNQSQLAFLGYDGSFTANALNLIPGNVPKAILERGVLAITGTTRLDTNEKSALFAWDGISTNWNDKKIVPIKGVNALIDTEFPLMQVGTAGQIYFSDMTNILPIFSFPEGGQVNPGAVTSDGGLALFGVYGNGAGYSGVYSYGRKKKNQAIALNLEYQFNCDEIGALTKVGNDILFSTKVATVYALQKVNLAAKATAYYYSLDLKLPTPFQKLPTVDAIVVQTASLPAGTTIEAYYRMDKKNSFIQAQMEGNVTTMSVTGATEGVFLVGEKGKICEIELKLTPATNTCPEVYKIEVYFSP